VLDDELLVEDAAPLVPALEELELLPPDPELEELELLLPQASPHTEPTSPTHTVSQVSWQQ
jgi:hypothetical protein